MDKEILKEGLAVVVVFLVLLAGIGGVVLAGTYVGNRLGFSGTGTGGTHAEVCK